MPHAHEVDPLLTFGGVKLEQVDQFGIDELLRMVMWKTVLEYQRAHVNNLSDIELEKLRLAMTHPSDELWEMVVGTHEWLGDRLTEYAIRLSNYQMGYGAVAPGYDDDDGEDEEEEQLA